MSEAERQRLVVAFHDRLMLIQGETERLARDMEDARAAILPGPHRVQGSVASLNRVLSYVQSNCIRISSIISRAHRENMVRRAPPKSGLPSTVIEV